MSLYYLYSTGDATTDVALTPDRGIRPYGWIVGFHAESADEAELRKAEHIAFSQRFWDEKLALVDDPAVVRVKGQHYYIRPDATGGSLGHGGMAFHIQFMDGRFLTSHNLWSQGTIPSDYRDRLPDNAVFLKERPVLTEVTP